jgi:hypothetical protein
MGTDNLGKRQPDRPPWPRSLIDRRPAIPGAWLYVSTGRRHGWPALTGGSAAMITLSAYPPAAHQLWAKWQRTGQPPDPATRLIPDWVTAITGTRRRVRQVKRRTTLEDFGQLADFPAEVDQARFGGAYWGGDQEHRAARYVIVCTLMLAAQEKAYRQLDDAERDAYCAGCADNAGYAFGIFKPPEDYAGLRAAYEAILDGQLQGTSFGQALLTAMLARQAASAHGADLARDAMLLVDERTTGCVGLDEVLESVRGDHRQVGGSGSGSGRASPLLPREPIHRRLSSGAD